ncbi:MAG: carboxyltransferase domain-containing protein [Bacteroidota bacterium]
MVSASRPYENGQLHIQNFNNDFLLIRAEGAVNLAQLGQYWHQQHYPFVREVIVAEREICLQLHPDFTETDLDLLFQPVPKTSIQPRGYSLPIRFSPVEDWRQIIQHTGRSREAIIEELCAQTFSVAMFGFLPGFLYLRGLPEHLQVPRKAVPAKYVPAGSIAIGGAYLGAYAVDSPGGWHIIGQTPLRLLHSQQLPPSPFQVGDQIRLRPIDEQAYKTILADENYTPSLYA